VLHNGALIVEAGRVIRCRPLALDVAREAIRAGCLAGADPVVHCGTNGEGQLLVAGVSRSNTLLAYYLDKAHPDVRVVHDLAAALPEAPIQVMFGGEMEGVAALEKRLRGCWACVRASSGPSTRARGRDPRRDRSGGQQGGGGRVSRSALGPAFERHPRGRRQLERPGDARAGGSRARDGNADPAMHALGLPSVPGNDEDGVAVAIERHILAD